MPTVNLPDGSRINFPEGMSVEEMQRVVQEQYEPMMREQRQQQSPRERAAEVFGFKDYEYRGAVLPFGRTEEGETEMAWPQVAVDMATSAITPRHVYEGGQWSPEDATNFTLDYLLPATARGPKARPTTGQARRAMVRNAPSTDDLMQAGSKRFEDVRKSGVVIRPEKFQEWYDDAMSWARRQKLNKGLHKKTYPVMEAIGDDLGQAPDPEDVQIVRRVLSQAANTVDPDLGDDRRIAAELIDRLDDMMDNLTADDLVSQDGTKNIGQMLNEARAQWARGRKSQTIEAAIEAAKTQASGFENGLRIQFRHLLKNKKLMRGFTDDEKKIIKEIATGTKGRNLLKLLGKLSYGRGTGSNFLGGHIGAGTGFAVGTSMGGPAMGAVTASIPPAIGYAAQKGAEVSTSRAAQLARALATSGGRVPPTSSVPGAALAAGGPKVAGPTLGALLRQQDEQGQNWRAPNWPGA